MSNRIMMLGEKETFLIRVLTKKINEAGYETVYVPMDVNAINAEWEKISLITYYMDTDEVIPMEVSRFLDDKMIDDNKQMIVIGDKNDVNGVYDRIPNEMIYKSFFRPLNNDEYIKTINDLFNKIASGELKKSILIVDDDPTYAGLVREWLKADYKVSMVASGIQAMKWLGKNSTDLILLDYEMPVTSGAQVLEMLRSDSDTKSIPVMFLTGKSDRASVMEVVALKPENYFLKSIGREELLEKLGEFFMKKKI